MLWLINIAAVFENLSKLLSLCFNYAIYSTFIFLNPPLYYKINKLM